MVQIGKRGAVVYTPTGRSTSAGTTSGPDNDTKRFDTFSAAENAQKAGKLPAGALVMHSDVADAGGAYFYKIATEPNANHHGIHVDATLPEVMFDPKRYVVEGAHTHAGAAGGGAGFTATTLDQNKSLDGALGKLDDYRTGPLDRPSVYLGGHASNEADVGLTWDRVYDKNGRATFTSNADGSDGNSASSRFVVTGNDKSGHALVDGDGKVVAQGDDAVRAFMKQHALQPNFAFRPYWRTQPKNEWHNPKPGAPDNRYFYPGDKIAMTVQEHGKNSLRLDVRAREDAARSFSTSFDAPGFGDGRATQWKRVSSIDQFQSIVNKDGTTTRKGNEGGDVIKTATTAIGASFDNTQVLVGDKREAKSVYEVASPHQVRGKDLAAPAKYDSIFDVDVAAGVERLDIKPK